MRYVLAVQVNHSAEQLLHDKSSLFLGEVLAVNNEIE